MRGHNVLFDMDNDRVGIALSNCNYAGGNDVNNYKNELESHSINSHDDEKTPCLLGEKTIEQSCEENPLVTSKCFKVDPLLPPTLISGTELLMYEILDGTDYESCEMELTVTMKDTNVIPLKQYCNPDGFCHALVTCTTTCAKQKVVMGLIKDATEQIENSTNTNDTYYDYDDDKDILEGTIDANITGSSPMEKEKCRRNGKWSACMPDCRQTRRKYAEIQGKCTMIHVKSKERDRRVCHIDACGSKDPCRVPFVVASFLSFPGDFSERWDWQAKEKLILSFSKALNSALQSVFQMKKDIIGVGDVKIVEVMNTTKGTSSDESSGADNVPGFSIIVEVSILNTKIEPPEEDSVAATIGKMEDKKKFNKFLAKTKKLWKDRKHVNCTESDIFAVSETAMRVLVVLEADTFPDSLLSFLANEYKSKRTASPFQTSLANYDKYEMTFFC